MKIAVIASTPEKTALLKEILEAHDGQDQYLFLARQGDALSFDGIDLLNTHVVLIESSQVDPGDLLAIAGCTRNSTNPAFIFITSDHSESRLMEMMHAGVSEVVTEPVDGDALHESIERVRSRHYIASATPPRGKVISFVSCKGGAGATFLATNIGYALATICNKKVLYIDLHQQYGDAAFYLTESAGPSSYADIIGQAGLDSTVVASASMQIDKNFFLLQAPDTLEKTSGIKPQQVDNLLTVAIQDYDFVIIDLAETFDALTMKALDRSEQIYAVMQPVLPYMRAMSKILHVFTLLGYSAQKVKVLLNRMDKDVKPSQSKIEEAIQKPCDWVVPNDYLNCIESVNAGIPILKLAPDSTVSKHLMKLAYELAGTKHVPNKSLFSKLFG